MSEQRNKQRAAAGENRHALAAAFGISPDYVNQVIRGRTWVAPAALPEVAS
jgi:DNA-binding transcriptional regulator YdaS (Cro superfamily)